MVRPVYITVLNVISLSYIMSSVIIKHNDSLCILCVDILLFVSFNVLRFDGQYCIVLWTLLHSFIAFLVLLSWLYNLAVWLQFLINLLTYLLENWQRYTFENAALILAISSRVMFC